jgi:hypothetical protein
LTVVSDSEYSTASVLFYFPVKASNVVEWLFHFLGFLP